MLPGASARSRPTQRSRQATWPLVAERLGQLPFSPKGAVSQVRNLRNTWSATGRQSDPAAARQNDSSYSKRQRTAPRELCSVAPKR